MYIVHPMFEFDKTKISMHYSYLFPNLATRFPSLVL